MKYRERILEQKIVKLFQAFPVVVVNGARQTGKSTILNHLFGATMKSVVFDPVIDVGNARADPELFLSLNPPPIILDEIQYCPDLMPAIKRRVDRSPGRNGLYLITGSQQFSVIRAIGESLAGRAALLTLAPFSLAEIAEEKGVARGGLIAGLMERGGVAGRAAEIASNIAGDAAPIAGPAGIAGAIFRGGYPRTLDMADDTATAWFEGYLRTYVERDIRTLGDVGDMQAFSRFVRLAAQLTAQEINLSHLGREIGIDPKTARAWLAILKASYQWTELAAYSGNATKRISEKPKGHFTDTGFACYLASIFSRDSLASHPLFGALFESAVVCEAHKQLAALPAMPAAYHWRSHGGAEVDMVVEKDGLFWLLEAKLAARPGPGDARGMRAFCETYPGSPIAGRIIVSGGEECYALDSDTIVVPFAMLGRARLRSGEAEKLEARS